jgi:two-component system, NtrC family, sensor kinase
LYIINRQYELVTLNSAVAQRAGQSFNDLNGRLCYQALYQRTSPCSGCLIEDTLMKGKSTLRTAYRSPEQDTDAVLTYEIHSFPIYDFSAQIMQAILMEQDITDRRELEAVVAQSGKLAALGQLAAGVAHEINNPLTAIIANAQILQRELPPGDERLESVELIAMAGARAAQVVRNLLDFARKEQSQRVLTNINETLRASLALVQHELVSRSVSLHFKPDDGLPMILAAPDSLQGVWLNLLLNAIEAIDKQTGVVQVISQHEDDNAVIIISDNGRGIPADRLERIFEPFYTTKGPGRGTGLGLSVCRRIVEQHGGLISVESQLGLGTEFKVVFRVP